MADRHDHVVGFWGYLFIGLFVVVPGVIYGMAYLPAYISYWDVKEAVRGTAREAYPVYDDEKLRSILNRRLSEAHASRLWVENGEPQSKDDLEITPEQFTVERQGTAELTLKVDFTQQVYLHVLKRTVDLSYHCEWTEQK